MRLAPLLCLALLPSLAAAECPSDATSINAATEPGLAAFGQMDATGFLQARGSLRELAACPGEVLPGSSVASVHLIEALGAFLERDTEAATSAFRGALAAQPDFTLDPALAPEGSALHGLYSAATDAPAGAVALWVPPPGTTLVLDGAPVDGAARRPTDRDTYAQLLRDDAVLWSAYLPAGTSNPDLSKVAQPPADAVDPDPAPPTPVEPVETIEPVEPIEPRPEPLPTGRKSPVATASLGGATAIAAGGALVALLASNRAAANFHDDGNPDPDSRAAWAARSNQLFVLAQVGGAATVGLGAVTVGVALGGKRRTKASRRR